MRVFNGIVSSGFRLAGRNLQHVIPLIIKRTGLPSVVPGTLNVKIDEPYMVIPDAMITCEEYNGWEAIKLQRCKVGGLCAIVMRPITQEKIPGWGNGPKTLELLSHHFLRDALCVVDGDAIKIELEGDSDWWREN